jgi:hypothetical protein
MLTQYELKQRINLEKRIARVIVRDAIKAGYFLNVNNGGDENELLMPVGYPEMVLEKMFQTDEEHLLIYNPTNGKQIGWVFFVYGNDGWDVVNDYTTNLESIMRNANKIADKHS